MVFIPALFLSGPLSIHWFLFWYVVREMDSKRHSFPLYFWSGPPAFIDSSFGICVVHTFSRDELQTAFSLLYFWAGPSAFIDFSFGMMCATHSQDELQTAFIPTLCLIGPLSHYWFLFWYVVRYTQARWTQNGFHSCSIFERAPQPLLIPLLACMWYTQSRWTRNIIYLFPLYFEWAFGMLRSYSDIKVIQAVS